MVEINRVWINVDTDTNKITLFGRPRVSIRVDEYIWSLIEEHIVKPHKLMRSEKHRYLLKISFHRFDPVRHRYYPLSPYNGPLREGVKPDSANGWYPREDFADAEERATWFSPDKIWTNCGNKVLDVNIDAANVSESITPREYADLLFDGIGAALVFNFKRLKREEFDGLKPKIDWSVVERFSFPAPFEDQQYIGDEGKIHVYSWDGRQETTLVCRDGKILPQPAGGGNSRLSLADAGHEHALRAGDGLRRLGALVRRAASICRALRQAGRRRKAGPQPPCVAGHLPAPAGRDRLDGNHSRRVPAADEQGSDAAVLSVTSALPSIMNGGKDFSPWSKKDDLLYKPFGSPWRRCWGGTAWVLRTAPSPRASLKRGRTWPVGCCPFSHS